MTNEELIAEVRERLLEDEFLPYISDYDILDECQDRGLDLKSLSTISTDDLTYELESRNNYYPEYELEIENLYYDICEIHDNDLGTYNDVIQMIIKFKKIFNKFFEETIQKHV